MTEQLDRFNQFFKPLWVFLHEGHVVRRIVLGIAVWMTLDSYEWAKLYAATDEPNTLIYAAVLGVPSGLLALALKFYTEGRNK